MSFGLGRAGRLGVRLRPLSNLPGAACAVGPGGCGHGPGCPGAPGAGGPRGG